MLYLEKPSLKHETQFAKMMSEWHAHGGRINPSIMKYYDKDYEKWLQYLEDQLSDEKRAPNRIPSSTFFVMNEENLIGAISIRHYLNDDLKHTGGHIAYGIRPSCRGNGYAKEALKMALKECRHLNIYNVLITCDKENIASAKVIQSQGGILENEVIKSNGLMAQRYWIDNHVSKEECIFCQIINGMADAKTVYEDDLVLAFMDIDPINQGHVLIITKTHKLDLDALSDIESHRIMDVSKLILNALKEVYTFDGYSMMQDGGMFNDIGHYHMHIFPRYHADGFSWQFSDEIIEVSEEKYLQLKEKIEGL